MQKESVADQHADLLLMNYPANSIEEVRLHHVFEHFSRPIYCALLASWNSWLKIDGVLHIEVPDFEKTAKAALKIFSNKKDRFVALRHIFGSQEAHWAVHYEGHTPESLKNLMQLFGFKIREIRKNNWMGTYNFEIIAEKKESLTQENCGKITSSYLQNFLLDDSQTEQDLLSTWMELYLKQVQQTFALNGNN